MATHPIPTPFVDEHALSREESWALLESLAGSMKGWFPEEGGPSEVLRHEREAWSE